MSRRPAGRLRSWVAEREPLWAVVIPTLNVFVRVWTRLQVTGLERLPRTGPALLAANHVSFLDPVVLIVLGHRAARRKTRFLGVQEAFDAPISGFFIRAGRHIPIGRAGERAAALRLAKAALDRGDLVLIYPEGTIASPGEVASAKGGTGLLALTSGVPVLPVATFGLERGMPWWRRRRAAVVIGPPVDLSPAAGLAGRQRYEAASNLVLEAIRRLPRPAEGAVRPPDVGRRRRRAAASSWRPGRPPRRRRARR